jgi:hypothetical protein
MPEHSGSDDVALFRLMVEQMSAIAAARREASRFFLTFNSAVLGAIGYAITNKLAISPVLEVAAAAAMAIVSIFWWSMLAYYGRISHVKFKVLKQMEKTLPFQPYAAEDEIWANSRPGLGASAVEACLPVLFGLAYLLVGVLVGVQIDWVHLEMPKIAQ